MHGHHTPLGICLRLKPSGASFENGACDPLSFRHSRFGYFSGVVNPPECDAEDQQAPNETSSIKTLTIIQNAEYKTL